MNVAERATTPHTRRVHLRKLHGGRLCEQVKTSLDTFELDAVTCRRCLHVLAVHAARHGCHNLGRAIVALETRFEAPDPQSRPFAAFCPDTLAFELQAAQTFIAMDAHYDRRVAVGPD